MSEFIDYEAMDTDSNNSEDETKQSIFVNSYC